MVLKLKTCEINSLEEDFGIRNNFKERFLYIHKYQMEKAEQMIENT